MTLAECAVALAAGALVLAALHALLLLASRARTAEAARVEARASARAAAAVLRAELQSVSAAAGDLVALDDTALTIRALRSHGSTCAQPAGDRVTVRSSSWAALRAPDPARDVARIFLEGDPDDPSDDTWWVAGIRAVGTAACPDGAPGILLTLAQPAPAAIAVGAPVRVLETVEYRAYCVTTAECWLGTRTRSVTGWSTTSPIVGPLRPGAGLHVEAHAQTGAITAQPAAAALLVVAVRTRASQLAVRPGGARVPVDDSLWLAIPVGP